MHVPSSDDWPRLAAAAWTPVRATTAGGAGSGTQEAAASLNSPPIGGSHADLPGICHTDSYRTQAKTQLEHPTRLGLFPWLDFYLIFYDCGWGSVENVDWIVTAPYEPTSSQAGLSWDVDNDAPAATLDFVFTEALFPSETATFSIYTDNTSDQLHSFGVIFYPTIIPEPATGFLLALGLVGLAVHGRKGRV